MMLSKVSKYRARTINIGSYVSLSDVGLSNAESLEKDDDLPRPTVNKLTQFPKFEAQSWRSKMYVLRHLCHEISFFPRVSMKIRVFRHNFNGFKQYLVREM